MSNGAGTCPRSWTARSGCRASPNPRPAPTSPRCAPRREGKATLSSSTVKSSGPVAVCMPTGACCWPAPIPDAPKRKGISYFLLDMTSPGVEVRPIRNAVGDSHFCEIFLNDVAIPEANLVGAENAGWQVAQATLGAERGMTMLELAERLANAGFRRLVETVTGRRPTGGRPAGRSSTSRSPVCADCAERSSKTQKTERTAPPVLPTPRSSSSTTASCCSG